MNKKLSILLAGLFLITMFSSTFIVKSETQDPEVNVWITFVGHQSYHDIFGYHIDVDVCGDSDDDDYGYLHLWYRKSDIDFWHIASDYSVCPGCISETFDYDEPGEYHIFLKLQLGDSGPVYYSDVWEDIWTVSSSSSNQ